MYRIMCNDVVDRICFHQNAQHLYLKDSWGALVYFHTTSVSLDTIDVKQKINGISHLKCGSLQ